MESSRVLDSPKYCRFFFFFNPRKGLGRRESPLTQTQKQSEKKEALDLNQKDEKLGMERKEGSTCEKKVHTNKIRGRVSEERWDARNKI